MQSHDVPSSRRVELILRQVDDLPTLPSVATRLLSLTTDEHSHARQIVEVINSDPSLTSRILSLCGKADVGVRRRAITIDQAVVLLGFNAIRNAALSVKVVELFEPHDDGVSREADDAELRRFDRTGFWRHCLAVGIAAELIAAGHPEHDDLPAEEAFVCGLLHDVGKIALDHILPRSFARIIELTDLNQGNIAEIERRVVGLDHHTVGKRLAEHWGLPHRVQDCIWLHGSPYETMPRLAHRRLVGLISLADLVVRRHHIGYSGNHPLRQDPQALCGHLSLDVQRVESIVPQIYEHLEQRSKAMGLDDQPCRELFLNSIQRANHVLGTMNRTLERRATIAARQEKILDAISAFHGAATPGRRVEDVLNQVATSACSVLGDGFYAMLYQPERDMNGDLSWLICQYGDQARAARSDVVEPPAHAPDIRSLDPREPAAMNLMSILPWLVDYLLDAPDLRNVKLLPLSGG